MRHLLASLALLLGLLAGCSLLPSSTSAPGAPSQRSLASEQSRLADLFRGTPVVFEMQSDGNLQVTVPLHFSFEPGRAAVKPPLAAVLDRVAASQREAATRFRVAAPADPSRRNSRLALERAASTRDYLVARGIAPTRFAATEAAAGDRVQVTVSEAVD